MKKEATRKNVHDLYALMRDARLNGLKKTEDKVAVLRVMRELRYIAVKYDDDNKEASEKLMPKGYIERLRKAQKYEAERRGGKQPTEMSESEYREFIVEMQDYKLAVDAAMLDVDNAKAELEYEPVDCDVLMQLMTDNGWTVDQYLRVEEMMK